MVRISLPGLISLVVALFAVILPVHAEYNDKGEYLFPIEPWTDPDNPAVIKLDPDDPAFNQ